MDWNMKATVITAVGTWAAILGAAVIFYIQNRATKKLTCLQLYLELANRYDSDEINRRRSRLAQALIENPKTLEIDDTILIFYENVAFLMQRELLEPDLLWNTFGFDVCNYWSALEHYVMHTRKVFNDRTIYKEFEWLNNYMRDTYIHAGKLYQDNRDTRAGIDPAAVIEFLKMEERRSLEFAPNSAEAQQAFSSSDRIIQRNSSTIGVK